MTNADEGGGNAGGHSTSFFDRHLLTVGNDARSDDVLRKEQKVKQKASPKAAGATR